jgi:peptidoglycan/LPS O-acetylase OafA/YrhL
MTPTQLSSKVQQPAGVKEDGMVASGQVRLEGLEALRGLCALIVVFGHAATLTNSALLFIRMHLAVDLFFMLSGYVMARSYENKLQSGMRTDAFLRARIVRLWPTMTVGVFLGFIMVASWANPLATVGVLLCNLLFIPLVSGDNHVFPVVPVTWSIFFELFANVVHATILRRLPVPALAAIVLASATLLIARQHAPNPGVIGDEFLLGFPRVVYAYGGGVILWRVLRDRPIFPVWPALSGLLGFMAFTHFHLQGVVIDWVFIFGLAPMCIVLGLGSVPFKGFFRLLGALSFPLYAVHGPILSFMASRGFGMAASMASAIVVAFLTMRVLPMVGMPFPDTFVRSKGFLHPPAPRTL